MPHTTQHILRCGLLTVAVFAAVGCAPKRAPPMTVADLMEDRVTLDGVLLKCNENPAKSRNTSDCLNARIAIERLARDVDPADEAKRNEEFERRREKLRLSQEKLRQEQEAKTKVDPYNLPLVPVDAAAPSGSVPGAGSGPGLAQTQPGSRPAPPYTGRRSPRHPRRKVRSAVESNLRTADRCGRGDDWTGTGKCAFDD